MEGEREPGERFVDLAALTINHPYIYFTSPFYYPKVPLEVQGPQI